MIGGDVLVTIGSEMAAKWRQKSERENKCENIYKYAKMSAKVGLKVSK